MKRLINFILCLIFPATFFAQDMIVKSNGEKINCKIVAIDSAIVSYASADTTQKEISVLQKEDVLATQLENSKTNFYFIPDTLIKSNGNKTICKIIAIDPTTISYLAVDSTIGDLTLTMSKKFELIRFGNGSQEVVDTKSDYTDSKFSRNLDYYKMGQADAKTYYKCPFAVAGEIASGLTTYVLGFGLITGVAIYVTPPADLNNSKNPNNNLLKTNHDYYEGYRATAKRIKHRKCGLAYGGGVLAPVALVLGVAYALGSEE